MIISSSAGTYKIHSRKILEELS